MRVSLVYATRETFGLRGDALRYQLPVDVEVNGPFGPDLDHIFDIFNRHDDLHQHPDLDRLGLRSLSVGDIVILGDKAWRCGVVGWHEVGANDIRYVP